MYCRVNLDPKSTSYYLRVRDKSVSLLALICSSCPLDKKVMSTSSPKTSHHRGPHTSAPWQFRLAAYEGQAQQQRFPGSSLWPTLCKLLRLRQNFSKDSLYLYKKLFYDLILIVYCWKFIKASNILYLKIHCITDHCKNYFLIKGSDILSDIPEGHYYLNFQIPAFLSEIW